MSILAINTATDTRHWASSSQQAAASATPRETIATARPSGLAMSPGAGESLDRALHDTVLVRVRTTGETISASDILGDLDEDEPS